MPFETSGSLTTDEQQIGTSGGWDTQSEWEAYQAASNVQINSGVVTLAETIPSSDLTQIADHIWYMDEGSGQTIADSVGTQDGTLNYSTWGTGEGAGDTFLDPDNTDDIAACGDVLGGSTDFTIACWAKIPNDTASYFVTQDAGAGPLINTTDTPELNWQIGTSGGITYAPNFGVWHLIALVYNDSGPSIDGYAYEVGVGQVYSDTAPADDATFPNGNYTWHNRNAGDRPLGAPIDYGIVALSAATESDITDHYNQTVSLYQ